MKTNEKKERIYFIKVGLLMALLGFGFVYYMGNCLYYASQKLFEDFPEYVDVAEQWELEELS